MRRRHQIVHRADSTDESQKRSQKAAPISIKDVNKWLTAVREFEKIIVVDIIQSEYEASGAGRYIAMLRTLTPEQLSNELEGHLSEGMNAIIDSEAVGSAIAETNASGFYVDDYHVTKTAFDETATECRISVDWHASGDSDPDKTYCGDEIVGTAVVILNDRGQLKFEDIAASRKDDSDGYDSLV